MSHFIQECPDIKIASGTAISNVAHSKDVYDDAEFIVLQSPSSLDAHTYVLEFNFTEEFDALRNPVAPVFTPLFDPYIGSAGANLAIPAAGLAQIYLNPTWISFRIHDTTGNAAADRIWKMSKAIRIYR